MNQIIPAQLIVFILQADSAWTVDLVRILEDQWGPIRHRGTFQPFDQTAYYTPEMGTGLFRAVASFERLIDPGEAAREKLNAIALERRVAVPDAGRCYNFDIGYMDPDKVVLPSCKQGPWKIYWGEGIWLDIVMHYAKGAFSGSPWSFEDFLRNPYQRDLLLIREKYKKALKNPQAESSRL